MAVKILSVDDERDLGVLLTQYFRRQIWKGEYKFAFAHNGLETLQKLLETLDFDIILSDINMPEMDGLTLLAKINELKNLAMKSIMVCLWRYGQHQQAGLSPEEVWTEENYRIFRTEYDNCERLWNKYYPNASVLWLLTDHWHFLEGESPEQLITVF